MMSLSGWYRWVKEERREALARAGIAGVKGQGNHQQDPGEKPFPWGGDRRLGVVH